jgi:prepilin-type N-terminal cleavage/methylation domain-containing protein
MRRAFTLVEMLIAMVLTLILITAIAQFYAIIGESVKDGRAMIELGGQVRNTVSRLNEDFDCLTSNVQPWIDDGNAGGYFEYYEGRACDWDSDADGAMDTAATLAAGVTNMLGDGDDFLAFTIRGKSPLNGRVIVSGNLTIGNSQFAEVAWWVGFDDTNENGVWNLDEPRHLYRRQLLIRPDLSPDGNNTYANATLAQTRLRELLQLNDVSMSVRAEPNNLGGITYRIRANSLSDLSRREHRFAHRPTSASYVAGVLTDDTFPHQQLLLPAFSAKPLRTVTHTAQTTYCLLGDAAGEDVMLSGVLACDVQVFDPFARLWPSDPTAVNGSVDAMIPSDPGYSDVSIAAKTIIPAPFCGFGAFVDLGYYRYLKPAAQNESATAGMQQPYYAGLPAWPYALANATQVAAYQTEIGCAYDTWPLSYERDSIFQLSKYGMNALRMDMGTNGTDDDGVGGPNGINGVDDTTERETNAPYQQPLRGLQVRIRVYEPSTRQAKQVTVATDFVTE